MAFERSQPGLAYLVLKPKIGCDVTFVTLAAVHVSVTMKMRRTAAIHVMEVLTSKATRRSTRIRVEIPVSVTSLDRQRPFAERCMVLIVSAQGCGFRSSRALQLETPVIVGDLPGGGSVTARVANCLPLGNEGFLIGAALYTHGNVWGIVDPPEDWSVAAKDTPTAATSPANAPTLKVNKEQWPYNLASMKNAAGK